MPGKWWESFPLYIVFFTYTMGQPAPEVCISENHSSNLILSIISVIKEVMAHQWVIMYSATHKKFWANALRYSCSNIIALPQLSTTMLTCSHFWNNWIINEVWQSECKVLKGCELNRSDNIVWRLSSFGKLYGLYCKLKKF